MTISDTENAQQAEEQFFGLTNALCQQLNYRLSGVQKRGNFLKTVLSPKRENGRVTLVLGLGHRMGKEIFTLGLPFDTTWQPAPDIVSQNTFCGHGRLDTILRQSQAKAFYEPPLEVSEHERCIQSVFIDAIFQMAILAATAVKIQKMEGGTGQPTKEYALDQGRLKKAIETIKAEPTAPKL